MTFAELARAVAAAKRTLAPLVGPGDRAALWLPNGFPWIVSFLALASLKAVSVPVNTRLTPHELAVIVEDAGACAVVASPAYRGRTYIDEAAAAVSAVTPALVAASDDLPPSDWRVIRTGARRVAAEPVDTGGAFCIQYTSGTTSTPKGVLLTEARYLETAAYVGHCHGLTPNKQFMSAAPFFHCSGSMHAVTVCLRAGATLHTVSVWDPEYFLTLVARHRGEISHGIFFKDIVALGEAKAKPALTTLKVGYDISGEAFVRRLHGEFGITGICNIWGMTETCGNYTMWYPDDDLDKRIVRNGRPMPGNAIRIADPESGAVLGPERQGEIQIKGRTVTDGYFRRPEANRTSFTADGWFRTGDLGALGEAGELHFIARLRDIIRVGGENVSPAEVETAVQAVTGLKDISVISVPDKRLGEVAALVVTEAAAHRDWPAALAEVSRQLAGYKMPRRVYAAAALPMTATNKVQRATLQQWVRDGKLKAIV